MHTGNCKLKRVFAITLCKISFPQFVASTNMNGFIKRSWDFKRDFVYVKLPPYDYLCIRQSTEKKRSIRQLSLL